MSTKRALASTTLCMFAVSAAVIFHERGQAQEVQMPEKGVFKRLDEKAAKATRGDSDAVKDLADEILAPTSLPADLGQAVKTAVVQAEMDFRTGKRAGVKDTDVVRAFNMLAAQLEAPEYGYTTIQQVRFLRTSLAVAVPHLVGARSGPKDSRLPDLSPLEAVHLTWMMAQQKLNNPQYQVTAREWVAQDYETKRAKFEHRNSSSSTSQLTPAAGELQLKVPGERQSTLRQALATALQGKTPDDIAALVHSTLGQMNLDDQGGR